MIASCSRCKCFVSKRNRRRKECMLTKGRGAGCSNSRVSTCYRSHNAANNKQARSITAERTIGQEKVNQTRDTTIPSQTRDMQMQLTEKTIRTSDTHGSGHKHSEDRRKALPDCCFPLLFSFSSYLLPLAVIRHGKVSLPSVDLLHVAHIREDDSCESLFRLIN